ncbi:MAG: transposase [Pseudomonadales bacterium]|nr:transposase [Pseudomonadales bacterium]
MASQLLYPKGKQPNLITPSLTQELSIPRRRRFCPSGHPVHVIQRGHNRQICFTEDLVIATYVHFLEEGARESDVSVHGWEFMTNHVHLLLTPHDDTAISKLMYLGRL